MMPIPRRLLRQACTVRVPRDSFYRGEYEEPVSFGRVCYEPASSIGGTANSGGSPHQEQNPVRGTLFIDPRASEGAFEVPAGSLVKVDGMETEAVVRECAAIMCGGRVHHWEVVLK